MKYFHEHTRALAIPFWLALLLVLCGTFASFAPANAAGCSVSSSGMAFGSYQPLHFPGKSPSPALTTDASVSLVCTAIEGGGSFTLGLGPSSIGPGDRISTRYLANYSGGENMEFNVYTNATYSIIWGDGTAGSVMGGSIAAGDSTQILTVYGRIPAGQNMLRTGAFTGVLTVTLTYNP